MASDFVAAWRAVTTEGCLVALERGAPVDGALLGLEPTEDVALPYRAPAEVWRDPSGRFAFGAVAFPVEEGEARRLCEVGNTIYLRAETVNAVYSAFLDWAEAAQDAGRYSFQGTRFNRDSLTGLASLVSRFETPRARRLEVTFVAQPAEGRVTFSAVEMLGEVE